jgi:hypothetical protein
VQQRVENSEQYVLRYEDHKLEIFDLQSNKSFEVEKVFYHDSFELYLFKVDGIMAHNFILNDEVASWLRSIVEVQ